MAEIVKGFPTLVLRGGDIIPADFISCSSILLFGSGTPGSAIKAGLEAPELGGTVLPLLRR